MTKVFLHIFNLSITASWLIAAVLLVRWIIKGKTPRWVSCLLWAFVGLRLVIPFYFESDFSIIPSKETVIPEAVYGEVSQEIREPEVSDYEQIGGETEQIGGEVSVSPLPETSVGENITADGNQAEPEKIEVVPSKKEPTEYIHSGFHALDERVNEVINEAESEETAEEVGVVRRVTEAASVVWLCGVVLMLVYAAVNYLLLKKRVSVFVPEKGNIRRSENVGSPFILGFVRPKIYLPFGLTKETEEHIIAHELAHLNRRDHWIKPIGFALLSVYWFNPLVWVAYILLCRDIEYACDEKVVKEMSEDARKAYATALLECGVKRNMIAACPVAFGEIGVKDRVKSALSYKKPMLWIIIAAVVISAVTAGVFLLAPKDGEDASSVEESSGESDVSGGILDDPSPNNEVVLDFDSELGGDCIVGLYKSFPDDVPLYSEFGNNVYIAKYKDGKIGTQKIFDGKETDFFARASSVYEKDGNVYGMLSLGETFSNYQRYYCRFNKDGSVERLFECFNVLYKDEKVYFCERYSGPESGDLRFRICSADIDGSGKSILAEDIPVPVLYDNFLVCDDGVVYLSNDDKEINILRQDGTTENLVRLTDGSCQIRFINNGFVYYTQSERTSGKDHFHDKDDIYRHSLIRIKLNGEDAEQLLTKDIVGYGLGFAPVTFGSKLLVFHESEVEVYEETLSDPVVYEYKEFSYDQIFQVCVTKDWLAVIGSDGNGSAKTVVYNTKGEVTFNSDNEEKVTAQIIIGGNSIENVTADIYSDCAIVPFKAVLRAFGFIYQDIEGGDCFVSASEYNWKRYHLDLDEQRLCRLDNAYEHDINVFDKEDGSYYLYRNGQELYIDDHLLLVVLRELTGQIPTINVDRTNRTVTVYLPPKPTFTEYGYKLFVNGEEVEIEDDKIFCNENDIMLSYITVMTALDAEFEWQSDTVAKMYWADMTFTLDIEKCELTHDEAPIEVNFLCGPMGGRRYFETLEKDILISRGTFLLLFSMTGVEMRAYSVAERSVKITTTSEYPRKLEYS